ncbi:hypothetical protein [Subtercola sp. YIM 133946]|uniref:hypothetical protein n=1 Tax=Subtercola sp. YIM 133946 TaxID=3118909 RepID=UPI002F9214B7
MLLLARTAPFLVSLLTLHVSAWQFSRADLSIDDDVAAVIVVASTASAVLAMIGVIIVVFAVSRRTLVEHPRAMRIVGSLTATYYLAVDPWLYEMPSGDRGLQVPVMGTLVDALVVGAAVCATWCGVGSVAAWAARTSMGRLRSLGEMSTRALPLLMLVVFFSFFSPAIWAVTASMTILRLLGVVAVFAFLALLFMLPVTRSELTGVDDQIGVDERAELIAGTELPDLLEAALVPGSPLTRAERVNLHTVLMLAQGAQVGIFAGLVAVFLVALGEVALAPTVLATWLGPQPSQVELFGLATGVDTALVKTAVFLSCVSSLNFLVSATNNAAYKAAFYDPLFTEARVALAVRSAYRAIGQR